MKIGVLGSGDVGKALARGFKKHGYDIRIGTGHKEKLQEFSSSENIKTGSFSEVSKFADIVVLALKGNVAKDVLNLAEEKHFKNKIIIDVTNPISEEPPKNGVLKFFTSLDNSLMEQLQNSFPKAKFVKAFNSIGNAFMVNPDFNGQKPSMFICGNNEDAKKEVRKIVELFGFEAEDMGKAESARAIEPLSMLWCIPGLLKNKWSHAFKLLKKK